MNVQWNDRHGGCACKMEEATELPSAGDPVASVAGICSHRMNPPSLVSDFFPIRNGKVTVSELLTIVMTMWSDHLDTNDAIDHIFAFMVVAESGESFLLSRQDDEDWPFLYWNMCGEAVSDTASEPLFNYGFHTRVSVPEYVLSEIKKRL
jgi:hypothetical protein